VPFLCPECSSHGSLRISLKIELPPDSRSDEICLQIVKCSDCGFEGIAVYEESRRGRLDEESVQHTGYRATKGDLQSLRKAIRGCPEPGNWRCGCQAHQKLAGTDASGRWNALHDVKIQGSFAIKT
jgi:hypothetical protein